MGKRAGRTVGCGRAGASRGNSIAEGALGGGAGSRRQLGELQERVSRGRVAVLGQVDVVEVVFGLAYRSARSREGRGHDLGGTLNSSVGGGVTRLAIAFGALGTVEGGHGFGEAFSQTGRRIFSRTAEGLEAIPDDLGVGSSGGVGSDGLGRRVRIGQA
jgi:hypothetical protein